MARLDIERQNKLEPERLEHSKKVIENLGFKISYECDTRIEFIYENEIIRFFPYSGWHSGKNIRDGRGLKNLIKQIT